MNDGYESPFRLPEELKCTRPNDARRYPVLHSCDGEAVNLRSPYKRKRCPVHNNGLKQETFYWREWARWREEYSKPDATDETRQYALGKMLACVTEDNPPNAARKPQKIRVKTWHDIDGRPHTYVKQRPSDSKLVAVSAVSIILAVCMLICFLAILL